MAIIFKPVGKFVASNKMKRFFNILGSWLRAHVQYTFSIFDTQTPLITEDGWAIINSKEHLHKLYEALDNGDEEVELIDQHGNPATYILK